MVAMAREHGLRVEFAMEYGIFLSVLDTPLSQAKVVYY
jgi:hypothetical protein